MDTSHFYTVRGYQTKQQAIKRLTPSLEDYLEMICRSILTDGSIRVKELSEKLNVKPPSVSKMLSKLSQMGFVDYEKYGVIRLTPKGEATGKALLRRHEIVFRFFKLICTDDHEHVLEEAELVEHILSPETIDNLEKLLIFLDQNQEVYIHFADFLMRSH